MRMNTLRIKPRMRGRRPFRQRAADLIHAGAWDVPKLPRTTVGPALAAEAAGMLDIGSRTGTAQSAGEPAPCSQRQGLSA